MPALAVHGSGSDEKNLSLGESDTIARYLLTQFASQGPSFQVENPLSNMMARIHDVYLSPIQSCMYRPPPFGVFGTRSDALDEYVRQCEMLASLMATEGDCLYLTGHEVSLADATIFPSCVFASYMLPKFDRQLPAKLQQWYDRLRTQDAAFEKVANDMHQALQVWETNQRWAPLLGAGWRDDTERSTVFDDIVSGKIPATIVMEDAKILAIRDIILPGPHMC